MAEKVTTPAIRVCCDCGRPLPTEVLGRIAQVSCGPCLVRWIHGNWKRREPWRLDRPGDAYDKVTIDYER